MKKLSKTSVFQACLKNQLKTSISLGLLMIVLGFISLVIITGNFLYLSFLWGFLLLTVLFKPIAMVTIGYKIFLRNHRKNLERQIIAHGEEIEILNGAHETLSKMSEDIFELNLEIILPNLKGGNTEKAIDDFHKEKNKRDEEMVELREKIEALKQEKQQMKKELEWVSEKIN